MGVWMESKVKSMSLDQLCDERQELKRRLGWGTWRFSNHTENQKELRAIEEEIDLRFFGEVLLY